MMIERLILLHSVDQSYHPGLPPFTPHYCLEWYSYNIIQSFWGMRPALMQQTALPTAL